ncbi:MAG: ribonuclease J [Proteobacteria bacterium]|nr:ribonuclease J [Pseudomonadota bacterium]
MKYDFSFIACGGVGEIGSNCYLMDFGDECFLIDLGLSLCENLYPGIFASIPDILELKEVRTKLKGIIITHGHDDHIGALPYFAKQLSVPIYASSFAGELIKSKVFDISGEYNLNIHLIKGRNTEIQIGKRNFIFFKTYHSIPESYGFYTNTDYGEIVFTSDFKHFSFESLPKTPFLLFADATNAGVQEDVTEGEVRRTIDKIIKNTRGAFVSATFSTNLDRIKSLINLIKKNGRRLFVTGKSVLTSLEIAKKIDLIKDLDITPWEKINKYPRNEIAIITTGTQGEKFSSLKLMSQGVFKGFRLEEGDSIVISSRMIPGNEKNIYNMINQFLSREIDVYYLDVATTHSSGHGTQKELKKLLNHVKAKYIVPIHGEIRHLKSLKELAIEMGYGKDNIKIIDKSTKLVVKNGEIELLKHDPVKRLFLDFHDNSLISEETARERRKIGEEGVMHVKIKYEPFPLLNFECYGFKISENVGEYITTEVRKYISNLNRDVVEEDMENMKQIIKSAIKKHYKRKPLVILAEG